MKTITFALLGLLALIVGCGGGGASLSRSAPPPTPQQQPFQGQWTFTGTPSNGGVKAIVLANLTQSGSSSFFASPSNVGACTFPASETVTSHLYSPGNCINNKTSLDGTISGTNTVNIKLADVNVCLVAGCNAFDPYGSGTATGTFTISNSVVTTMQGNWTVQDQFGHVGSGTWTAQPNVPFSGTYTGTVNVNGSVPVTVTLNLLQDSNYGLTGTATLLHDPCWSSLNFKGQVIGGGFGAAINPQGLVSLAIGGLQLSPTQVAFGYKSFGACTEYNLGILTKTGSQQTARLSEEQKQLLGAMFKSVEAKLTVSDKQKQLLRSIFPTESNSSR